MPLKACLLSGRGLDCSAYLVFDMTLHEQHVYYRQLSNESVPFEFLSYLGPYSRDREIERVHLLDLGSLPTQVISISSTGAIVVETDSSQPLPVGLDDPLLGILPAHSCDTPISERTSQVDRTETNMTVFAEQDTSD